MDLSFPARNLLTSHIIVQYMHKPSWNQLKVVIFLSRGNNKRKQCLAHFIYLFTLLNKTLDSISFTKIMRARWDSLVGMGLSFVVPAIGFHSRSSWDLFKNRHYLLAYKIYSKKNDSCRLLSFVFKFFQISEKRGFLI